MFNHQFIENINTWMSEWNPHYVPHTTTDSYTCNSSSWSTSRPFSPTNAIFNQVIQVLYFILVHSSSKAGTLLENIFNFTSFYCSIISSKEKLQIKKMIFSVFYIKMSQCKIRVTLLFSNSRNVWVSWYSPHFMQSY